MNVECGPFFQIFIPTQTPLYNLYLDPNQKMSSAELDSQKVEEASHSDGQLNMKGVFLHVLGDALGSIVVLISALTIYFAEVSHTHVKQILNCIQYQ